MPPALTRPWLETTGLARCPPFHRDGRFLLALLAGGVVALGLHWLFAPDTRPWPEARVWLMVVLVWPVAEELVFRGLLQGELRRLPWGARALAGVTAANLATSLVFAALHFMSHPPLWAALVLVPSLVFGYFRDRHASLYPAIALHMVYNLLYLLATA